MGFPFSMDFGSKIKVRIAKTPNLYNWLQKIQKMKIFVSRKNGSTKNSMNSGVLGGKHIATFQKPGPALFQAGYQHFLASLKWVFNHNFSIPGSGPNTPHIFATKTSFPLQNQPVWYVYRIHRRGRLTDHQQRRPPKKLRPSIL